MHLPPGTISTFFSAQSTFGSSSLACLKHSPEAKRVMPSQACGLVRGRGPECAAAWHVKHRYDELGLIGFLLSTSYFEIENSFFLCMKQCQVFWKALFCLLFQIIFVSCFFSIHKQKLLNILENVLTARHISMILAPQWHMSRLFLTLDVHVLFII